MTDERAGPDKVRTRSAHRRSGDQPGVLVPAWSGARWQGHFQLIEHATDAVLKERGGHGWLTILRGGIAVASPGLSMTRDASYRRLAARRSRFLTDE